MTIRLEIYMRRPWGLIGHYIKLLAMGKDAFGVDIDGISQ